MHQKFLNEIIRTSDMFFTTMYKLSLTEEKLWEEMQHSRFTGFKVNDVRKAVCAHYFLYKKKE